MGCELGRTGQAGPTELPLDRVGLPLDTGYTARHGPTRTLPLRPERKGTDPINVKRGKRREANAVRDELEGHEPRVSRPEKVGKLRARREDRDELRDFGRREVRTSSEFSREFVS
ncbi:hypothetical protein CRG98_021050 [Punica granatum]|uniref:Uncharacterized protein n=1 Tax=Punica granatum TaxID=22663 RepID=A0A2I0JQL1_PUNGR|nr:hypothetical protein CRG98_021050 [Punica granatum]